MPAKLYKIMIVVLLESSSLFSLKSPVSLWNLSSVMSFFHTENGISVDGEKGEWKAGALWRHFGR